MKQERGDSLVAPLAEAHPPLNSARVPTQLSNPRTPKGAALRCPECQRYSHPEATTCAREIAALAEACRPGTPIRTVPKED